MKKLTFGGRQNSFWVSQGGQSGPISKSRKILIQNGGLMSHQKFQLSSSIRKCLKISDFLGGFKPPKGGGGSKFENFIKNPVQNGGSIAH